MRVRACQPPTFGIFRRRLIFAASDNGFISPGKRRTGFPSTVEPVEIPFATFGGPIEKTLPRAVDCSYTQRTSCYKVIRGLGARQRLSRFHAGLGSGST